MPPAVSVLISCYSMSHKVSPSSGPRHFACSFCSALLQQSTKTWSRFLHSSDIYLHILFLKCTSTRWLIIMMNFIYWSRFRWKVH